MKEELEEIKKHASKKSWTLMAQISALEVELRASEEKIRLLEGSSAWSTNRE